ncbi:MAG: hypothetical protein H0V36_01885 [Chloroflexi bacterium]|nr:hypothetical protein [Chloroflexota bacterium]
MSATGRAVLSGRLASCLVAAGLIALAAMPAAAEAGGRTSIDLRATYDARATIDWDEGTIVVRSMARITNTSGRAIDYLVLNSFAAALGRMEILRAEVDGARVAITVEDQNLLVPLAARLAHGAATEVLIKYRAHFRSGSAGRDYHFSRANGIISCLRWIPWVSDYTPFWESDWGEQMNTAVSPLVQVSITTDIPLTISSTGSRLSSDGLRQVFQARDVRDFNFTAAPDFETLAGDSFDGDTRIVVYSRTLPRQPMLEHAQQAIELFEQRLGEEYPYPRFTISEASGGAGHESPGHVWLGPTLSTSQLARLVVHETAHQWFYALVGSDQPNEPFADEAVAEFLTSAFFHQFDSGDCPSDRLDRDISYYGGCLYEVIYQQGSVFLEGIRRDIGARHFWAALRQYIDRHRFRFGSTEELLEALRVHAEVAGVDLLPRYEERFPRLY